MNSTTAVRNMWAADRCNEAGLRRLDWRISGTHASVNGRALEAFAALDAVLFESGYRTIQAVMPVQTYNCRGIDQELPCQPDGTNCSLHAYGIAVDIDPQHNPRSHGDPFSGRFQPHHVAAVEAIRSTGGDPVFRWGGRFGKPDRMHFEVNIRPGFTIDPSTVDGTLFVEEDDVTRRGDTGPDVADLQRRLNDVGALAGFTLDVLEVDGSFGALTEATVVAYQSQDGLDATGVANSVTVAKLYARAIN